MKPRERFIAAIKRQETDRVPRFNRYVGAVKQKMAPIFGVDPNEFEIKQGNDGVLIQIGINGEYSHRLVGEGETYTSEWGVKYQGIHGFNQPVEHPLKTAELGGYKFPDPNKPERMDAIRAAMKQYHQDYAVMVDLSCTLFEAGFHLRGMENFVMDAYENEQFVMDVIDGLSNYYEKIGNRAIQEGIDVIRIGDDVGVQTGLIMPPDKWRQLVKPYLKRMIASFKQTNPDIIVKYHSCGDFSTIIPDVIEMGVELIGSMQPCGALADPFKIKEEFGDKVAFLGGLDVQQLLPNGSPQDVREGVKKVLKAYASGGGYVWMPAHYVNVDVPLENIWAMLEAVKEYGNFPINID